MLLFRKNGNPFCGKVQTSIASLGAAAAAAATAHVKLSIIQFDYFCVLLCCVVNR